MACCAAAQQPIVITLRCRLVETRVSSEKAVGAERGVDVDQRPRGRRLAVLHKPDHEPHSAAEQTNTEQVVQYNHGLAPPAVLRSRCAASHL
jgi:hypothetical protein